MVQVVYQKGTELAPCPPEQAGGLEEAIGDGLIQCCPLFDGVTAMRMRLEMESYTEKRSREGVLEVNFCVAGRFETSFSPRDHVLLEPGDMAVSCYDGIRGGQSESWFPLGYYEGICLEVEPNAAGNWIEKNAPFFSVDFSGLKSNLLGRKWYMYGHAGPRCEHVFRELYENNAYLDPRLLQLKVLELLTLLARIPREQPGEGYYSAKQAELIRHLRDHLLSDGEGYVSLSRLAQEHNISVSHLQKLFKQVYGVPVYHYIKEYRLERAAVELVRGTKSITEIGQEAGYDNASKFTESFKRRYGTTPSQYRASGIHASKRDSKTKME